MKLKPLLKTRHMNMSTTKVVFIQEKIIEKEEEEPRAASEDSGK